QELADRMKDQRDQGGANRVVIATDQIRGLGAFVMQRFSAAYGSEMLTYEPMEESVLREALRRSFGSDRPPFFDIARAGYILSIGADFLGPWISQVQHNRASGEFRQGRPGQRGYLVQVEPRLSQTGANADEWVPIKPGTEGIFALSIASVLVSENLASGPAVNAFGGAQGLSAYRPDQAAAMTGIPAARITELARALARQKPGLVLGGSSAGAHTNGLFNLSAIYALNYLLGSVGTQGG